MIEVHHLNNSRSQRVLWLLEELEEPYEIIHYERNAETNLAPESLCAIHPLGKSPVIRVDGQVIFESGAILDFLARQYGGGRLAPKEGTPEHLQYLQWLHYAEGSALVPLILRLYAGRLCDGAAPLWIGPTSAVSSSNPGTCWSRWVRTAWWPMSRSIWRGSR